MRLISTIFFGIFFSTAYCQIADNTESHNSQNIYYQALVKYHDFIFDSTQLLYDTIYIQENYQFTDSIITNIGKIKIIKVSRAYSYLKSNKLKGFELVTIFPLQYENNEFSISFIPYWTTIERKKKSAHGLYSGSLTVFFKFQNNKFYFLRIENHQI